MKKAKADNKDLYMAILGYRNTVIDNIASPAQLLMGRKLHTNLPVTAEQLKPAIVDPEQVKIKLKLKQQKQKKHYDRGSKTLPNLKIRDRARMQIQGRWKPVVVTGQVGYPRSFIVSTEDGRKYWRNRRHLMKATHEPELVDDLEVSNNTPGEQREGDAQEDVHGNNAQEEAR